MQNQQKTWKLPLNQRVYIVCLRSTLFSAVCVSARKHIPYVEVREPCQYKAL